MDAFLMAALAIAILWHCPPEFKMYVTVKMNFAHCVINIYGSTRIFLFVEGTSFSERKRILPTF
jgi:hypothetical protein